MMKTSSLEKDKNMEENIIKDVRNLFRLKNLFEHEDQDYHKPVRPGNFWSENYIKYKSRGNRKTLLAEEYLNKIRPNLKDIINNLKKSDMWKIQLPIAINLISSKDNDEKCVIHSESGNIEIMINKKADEIIEEPFRLLV